MATAQNGDTVRVHYTGTLDSGERFDSSEGRQPLEFTLGEGQIIPGFEAAVRGLAPGESCSTRIEAADAYGARDDAMVGSLPRDQFPPDLTLSVGLDLQLQDQAGNPVQCKVVELNDEAVTLDANPPPAGQALTFAIELVEIA